MKGLLFLNGEPPTQATLESINFRGSFVVCADGAYNYLRDYCEPDILVGDFDSFNGNGDVRAKKVVRLSVDKDFTDGHIAMLELITAVPEDITIYGGTGRASDHELANYSLLLLAAESNISASIVSETHQIRLACGKIDVSGACVKANCGMSDMIGGTFLARTRIGARVSLVPFTDDVHIIKTRGLKYRIQDETYGKRHIKGISNEAVESEIEFEIDRGAALIFIEN